MIRTSRLGLAIVTVLLVAGLRPAAAQIAAVGSIRGTVTDEQGAVIGDVKVSAQAADAPAVTTTTDSNGAYRLADLPPGRYTVTAERSGMSRYSRTGVEIRAGLNIALDFAMKVGGLEQTVEVKADTPMLEVDKPVQAVNISGDFQRRLPLGPRKDWSEFLELTPGLTSIPLAAGNSFQIYSLRGGSTSGHVFQLDGADIGSFRQGLNNYTKLSTEALDDVQVKTGGIDAGSPLGFGVVVNIATVSGTNRFHGAAGAVYTPASWNDNNSPGGTAATTNVFQPDLSLGGPILKDKLWFFGAYRHTHNNIGISRSAKQVSDLQALVPGFEPFDNKNRLNYYYLKVNGNISAKHQYQAFYQRELSPEENNPGSFAKPLSVISIGGQAYGGRFTSILGASTTVRVSGSYNDKSVNASDSVFSNYLGTGPAVTVYNSSLLSAGLRVGSGSIASLDNIGIRVTSPSNKTTLQADVTHFRSGLAGTHEFQAGVFLQPHLGWTNNFVYANGGFSNEQVVLRQPGNPAGGYVPFYRITYDRAVATTASVDASDSAVYAQDSWRPVPRLTLNLGLRVDWIKATDELLDLVTTQSTEVGPRLGATYVLSSEGKDIVRAIWTRVHASPGALSLNSGTSTAAAGFTERWDNDLDGVFETTRETPAFTRAVVTRQIDPDYHLPYINEAIVGYQRQLPGRTIVGISGIHRTYRDMRALLAVNGIYDGGVFQGYRDPTQNEIFLVTNNKWNSLVYNGIELLATKRTERLQLIGSYTRAFRHVDGTWQPNDPAGIIQPDAFPNDKGIGDVGGNVTNSYNANAPENQAWQDHVFRAGITYQAPWKFVLSSSYSIQSGPYSGPLLTNIAAPDPKFGPTTVTLSNGRVVTNPLATTVRFVGPTRGDDQIDAPALQAWNIRIGRDFAIGKNRLEAAFDVFNVTNEGNFTTFQEDGGNNVNSANFGQAPDGSFNGATRQFARAAQVSLRFVF